MNNESTKKRNFSMFFITFFKKNLKIIIIIISIILIGFAVFIWLDIRNNNKNILISNQYNEAVILIKKDQKQKAINILKKIINEENNFYSPLSLYLILENQLEEDPKKILELFDKILTINKIDKANKDLIKIKKAFYLTIHGNEQKILDELNPIINSNSIWRNEAILLLINYFNSKGEKEKSNEYNELLTSKN
jgi:hypothetical protein